MLEFPGKTFFRLDRQSTLLNGQRKKGGGVCLYIDNKLGKYCKIIPSCTNSGDHIEILTVSLRKPGLKFMNVSVLYKPPKTTSKTLVDFLKSILSDLMPNNLELWILGDFNTDFLVRDNANTKKITSYFRSVGLSQLVKDITRPGKYKGTCIDWIVTNCPFVLNSGVSNVLISDHLSIYCIRKKKREITRCVYRTVRDVRKYDRNDFVNLLLNSDWDVIRNGQDPNIQWDCLYTIMTSILSIMCPFKRYKQRETVKPWLTPEIYRAIRYRESCLNLFRDTRHQKYYIAACKTRNNINVLTDNAKSNYFRNVLNNNKRNPKKFWRIIKNFTDNNQNNNMTPDFVDPHTTTSVSQNDIPDFLNQYFVNISERLGIDTTNLCFPNINTLYHVDQVLALEHDLPTSQEVQYYAKDIDIHKSSSVLNISTKYCIDAILGIPEILCCIFRTSILTGIFPSAWSMGSVILLPKTGDLTDPGNWRPITQTSVFAKLFEKIIYNRLYTHLDTQNVFTRFQYGFLPNKSTQLASFDLLKHIYSSLNNKKIFGAACLDISKAFDCINHKVLLHKLRACGLSLVSLKWFESYLKRQQMVIFDGKTSSRTDIRSGIGQGTILGPILFILYINDLVKQIGGAKINMYADDCILYFSGNSWERVHTELQNSLANISVWLKGNALKLNVKKSKCLIIANSRKRTSLNHNLKLSVSGEPLEFVDHYNYLGYCLDADMSLKPLLSHVKRITTSKIGTLCKIRKYMTVDSALAIYKQMILPLFDYSGFLLLSCNKTDREDLQTIQNNALRSCLGIRLNDRISLVDIHKSANLVSLEQRRCIQLLVLLSLHGQSHPDVFSVAPRNTRAANRKKFKTEKYENVKYKNSPYYKAAKLWDSLPPHIVELGTVTELKKHLKKLFHPYEDYYLVN